MKKLVNPTTYFFDQADKAPTNISPQIQSFVDGLLNKNNCELCKNQYDLFERIPRILIHCGHSFCTPCLEQFYQKRRVRCPMCLKLVKQLDSLERLPINHTIFSHLVEKEKKQCEAQKRKPAIKDANKFLFSEFEKVQKEAHRLENPQKYDDESGLPFCVFHQERVQHFFCESHSTFGCRVCIEIGHSKPDCVVVDLYTVQNPEKYQNLMEARIQEPNISETFAPNKQWKQSGIMKFGNIIDQQLMDDDSDEIEDI